MALRRASADISIFASADSTSRRTRPQKSISHDESKPDWNRLNAGRWVDFAVALVGTPPSVPVSPLALVPGVPLLAPPSRPITPRSEIRSRV